MLKRGKLKTIVSIVLAIGLMAVLVGDSAESVPGMDIDLGDSDASFCGEDRHDRSGSSVADAGDVNGDGYDDILIGAPLDCDGGTWAGQTYLILGKASGWAMDTDLSKANASFWGEGTRDSAGYSVAGAGDVNRDGYDDILIGAPYNDEGGTNAGQTYLILGKESGWAMDTNLSNANASFWGEASGDCSGYSVAGAGDVNRDGYDDILIGAWGNNEGGNDAGQTYLILGKESGWSMDTNLSNADASFLGEDAGDASGWSVTGAGDVNRDGYDDILIGAPFYEIRLTTPGQTYLIFGNASGWSMDIDLFNSDASFRGEHDEDRSGWSIAGAGDVNDDGYDDILIGAYWNDDGGRHAGQTYLILGKATGWSMDTDLSNVDASFWGEGNGDYAGYSVAGAGDANGDGYDDILIGAYGNDEGGVMAGQTYLILGGASGWSMDTNLSNANASFLGEGGHDDGWYDESGRSVAGAGDVNGDGYDDILIGAWGNDTGGNQSGKTYLVFLDYIPPKVINDATLTYAFTGDGFTFNMTVTDNHGVKGASVVFWYGDSQNHQSLSASLLSGDLLNGTWILDIIVPSDETVLHYFINVTDEADLSTRSQMKDIVIHDNDPPVLDDFTPSTATTGDNHIFTIDATDNINLTDVKVEYWYGDAGVHTNLSMTHVSGDLWSLSITVPSDSLDTLHYFFYAEDNSTNHVTTRTKDVKIIDTHIPNIGVDNTPLEGTTGDPFTFSVEVEDNFGVDLVWVEYWYGNGAPSNLSLSNTAGLVWEGTITIMDTRDDLHYIIGLIDTSGNVNISVERVVDIIDLDLDNDGVPNDKDAFPEDVAASLDSDGDGFPDGWNEGKDQADSTTGLRLDAFPQDVAASLDTDGDGSPNEWNPGMSRDDSTSDPKLMIDEFPDDPLEWVDTDGDGHGDNGDAFPEDPMEWSDKDGDDHGDNSDIFPDDPLEWIDTDGDGHGDNGDAFPDDPMEWSDKDGDSHGDIYDIFPNDPLEWADTDGDGHGDNGDAFPEDPFEWLDTDGDGHGDNGDAFPEDPLEWNDADDDGHGDNGDAFPTDQDEWVDTDSDGSGDNGDAFPDDAAASVDTDGDGHPDEWNTGKSKEDSTTGLKMDHHPDDPEKWEEEDESPSLGLMGALLAILVAVVVAYNRRMYLW